MTNKPNACNDYIAKEMKVIRKFDFQFPQVAHDEAELGEYGHRVIEEEIDETKAIFVWYLIDDFENKKEIFVKAEDQENNITSEEKELP